MGNKPAENEIPAFLESYHCLEDRKFEIIDLISDFQGRVFSGRQMRVGFLLTKFLAHTDTLINVIQNHFQCKIDQRKKFKWKKTRFFPFDHHSICSLSRVCYDAALMLHYISEPSLSLAQWNLRRKVLYLHDLTNRHRFLKVGSILSMQGVTDLCDFRQTREKLISEILSHLDELGIERDNRYTNGQMVFLDGVRGAVREAQWSLERFEFQQIYLSNFIHSHPVSFMRAQEHQIDFEDPSGPQFASSLVGTLMVGEVAESTLVRCRRFLLSEGDPLGQYFNVDGTQRDASSIA